MAVSSERFIEGMRQLAAGVTLVTTRHRGRRAGLTATSVCSVSADPPLLLVCVNRLADAHDLIRDSGSFCVNVLAKQHRALAEIFSGAGGVVGEDRFARGRWSALATGAPVLDGCLAAFDCTVANTVPAGTHSIFIGATRAVTVLPDLEPLIYVEGTYGLTLPLADEGG
jgi:flavin reductase (DIM6/NTAB) family NADH-FMN oxidoreductase RutF